MLLSRPTPPIDYNSLSVPSHSICLQDHQIQRVLSSAYVRIYLSIWAFSALHKSSGPLAPDTRNSLSGATWGSRLKIGAPPFSVQPGNLQRRSPIAIRGRGSGADLPQPPLRFWDYGMHTWE